MAGRSIQFYNPNSGPNLYVQTITEYVNNGVEGHLQFNGYYYISDEPDPTNIYAKHLPQKHLMHYTHNEDEPWDVSGNTSYFRPIENSMYLVNIHTRKIINNTDVISEIDDDDGGRMDVCFFPTNEQIIYFTVIKDLTVDDGYKIDWDA